MEGFMKRKQSWFGVILKDYDDPDQRTVLIGYDQKLNEGLGVKRITGFTGVMNTDTYKADISDTTVDENIAMRIPTSRIPHKMEHIDADIEFLKFLKKNKICGETLAVKLVEAQALEKTRDASKKNKGTRIGN